MLNCSRSLRLHSTSDIRHSEFRRGHSSVGRAPALQAGCQGFESPCLQTSLAAEPPPKAAARRLDPARPRVHHLGWAASRAPVLASFQRSIFPSRDPRGAITGRRHAHPQEATRTPRQPWQAGATDFDSQKKMPDSIQPSGISMSAIKQKLNCALLVSILSEPRLLSLSRS